MNPTESKIHSFIVKVWVEETAETGLVTWRGHITQVSTNERRYVQDLDDIRDFIASCLEDMGVKINGQRRLQQWIRWWKRYRQKK